MNCSQTMSGVALMKTNYDTQGLHIFQEDQANLCEYAPKL